MRRSTTSAFTRVFDALWWCTADPGPSLARSFLRSRVCSAPLRAALRPGNAAWLRRTDDAGEERVDAVGRPQGGERDRGLDADALPVRRHGGVLENAGDAARHHVGGPQIGLGEHREDRVVGLATGEIDLAHQPRQQPRRIKTRTPVAAVEGKPGDGKADAALFGIVDGAVE